MSESIFLINEFLNHLMGCSSEASQITREACWRFHWHLSLFLNIIIVIVSFQFLFKDERLTCFNIVGFALAGPIRVFKERWLPDK